MGGRALKSLVPAALVALGALGGSPSRATQVQDATRATQDAAPDWSALAAIEAPDARAEALRAALVDAPSLDADAIQTAYQVGVEEAGALRLGNARKIQGALHGRARATWSAINLALTLTRIGEDAAAETVLEQQLARTPENSVDARDLLSRYALVALGRGDDRIALDRLGRAHAAGSPDAAVVLARHHLVHGNREAARAVFRALAGEPDPGAWALRGWGLTLIQAPGSPSPDGRLRPSTPGNSQR